MTHFVRGYVRERFLKADVGVNGCNFAVAASGTCTIVSNEGNGRMASSIPKTQVIFFGTERIVPDFKALDVMMEMLNRSAVGSKISNYFSMMTGPGRAGEADGLKKLTSSLSITVVPVSWVVHSKKCYVVSVVVHV